MPVLHCLHTALPMAMSEQTETTIDCSKVSPAAKAAKPVSYTHLTLPTTPYV